MGTEDKEERSVSCVHQTMDVRGWCRTCRPDRFGPAPTSSGVTREMDELDEWANDIDGGPPPPAVAVTKIEKRAQWFTAVPSPEELRAEKADAMVEHPNHYQHPCGVEVIDIIRAQLGAGFGPYCEGNVVKYLMRWSKKAGVQDLKKARMYLNWLIEHEEGNA